MSFSKLPITLCGFGFLTAIVIWDLIFDFAHDKQSTHVYYQVMRAEYFPFSLVNPSVIVVTLISLLINLANECKVLDILTLAFGLPCLYIFVGVLIPLQREIVQYTYNDPKILNNYEICKVMHLVMLVIFIISIVFQMIARSGSTCCKKAGCKSKKYQNITSSFPTNSKNK